MQLVGLHRFADVEHSFGRILATPPVAHHVSVAETFRSYEGMRGASLVEELLPELVVYTELRTLREEARARR